MRQFWKKDVLEKVSVGKTPMEKKVEPPFLPLEPFCEEPRSSNGLKLIHEVAPKADESRFGRLTTLRK